MVGELELARLVLDGPVKAPLEAEQPYRAAGRQGGAAHLHERLVVPSEEEQRLRDGLLAGAALAANQHGDVLATRLIRSWTSAMRSWPKSIMYFDCACSWSRSVATSTFSWCCRCVGERHLEIGFFERLADEIRCAQLHGLHDRRGASWPESTTGSGRRGDLLNAVSAASPSMSPGITMSR